MYVFREFKPKIKDVPQDTRGPRRKLYYTHLELFLQPFNRFAKKFPKTTGVLKKIGNTLVVKPVMAVKRKAQAIRKKLCHQVYLQS